MLLSLLFFIFLIAIFGKILIFAIGATWSIFKILMCIVFFPLVLVGLVLGGLIYIAFPVLIVVGLISFLIKK